jgi:hypothetical protein
MNEHVGIAYRLQVHTLEHQRNESQKSAATCSWDGLKIGHVNNTSSSSTRVVRVRKTSNTFIAAQHATRGLGGTISKERENDQSDDYISYTARRNMAELAVEHVWIKVRFHRAWGFGGGGHRYASTMSSDRALSLRHSYVH